jgi:hypothetical protein
MVLLPDAPYHCRHRPRSVVQGGYTSQVARIQSRQLIARVGRRKRMVSCIHAARRRRVMFCSTCSCILLRATLVHQLTKSSSVACMRRDRCTTAVRSYRPLHASLYLCGIQLPCLHTMFPTCMPNNRSYRRPLLAHNQGGRQIK